MAWLARLRIPVQDQRGSGLVESVVAVAISGIAVVAFVVALSTGSIAVGVRDQQVVAQSLAQAQLEFISGHPYGPVYPHVYTYDGIHNPNPITLPEGYAISVEVDPIHRGDDIRIQKVTVTISYEGEDILTIETYKVDR